MKVNKAKDVDQALDKSCPLLVPLKPGQEAICGDKCTEQPNLNKIIILEIECLISQVNKKLESLSTGAPTTEERFKRKRLKNTALEEIDKFQKTTLHELRKELE